MNKYMKHTYTKNMTKVMLKKEFVRKMEGENIQSIILQKKAKKG